MSPDLLEYHVPTKHAREIAIKYKIRAPVMSGQASAPAMWAGKATIVDRRNAQVAVSATNKACACRKVQHASVSRDSWVMIAARNSVNLRIVQDMESATTSGGNVNVPNFLMGKSVTKSDAPEIRLAAARVFATAKQANARVRLDTAMWTAASECATRSATTMESVSRAAFANASTALKDPRVSTADALSRIALDTATVTEKKACASALASGRAPSAMRRDVQKAAVGTGYVTKTHLPASATKAS